jgi:hypothetical protein
MAKGTVLSEYIEWRDNVPHVVGREAFTKTSLSAMASVAVSLPYEPLTIKDDDGYDVPDPKELKYVGMTCGEVMMIRQAKAASYGDYDATNMLLDRICGKPKQSIDSLNVAVTLQDYLNTLPPPPEVQDVTNLLELRPEDSGRLHAAKLKRAQAKTNELVEDL